MVYQNSDLNLQNRNQMAYVQHKHRMKSSTNNLMYIKTDEDEEIEQDKSTENPYSEQYKKFPKSSDSTRSAWQRQSVSEQNHVQMENESITEIGSVAKLLFGNNYLHKRTSVPASYTPSWQENSDSGTLLPPISNSNPKINKLNTLGDTLGTTSRNREKSGTLRGSPAQAVGYHGRRRNSLMVPLPHSNRNDLSPLISPCPRQRSYSLSPVHRLPKLSHIIASDFNSEPVQPRGELLNRRRRTISNGETLPGLNQSDKTRTPSSLDLV